MEGAANYQMSYVQPASELIQEKDRDILVLNLPGFKKELLKAELTSESRILKISGARQLEDKRWIGFDKDFPVSPNCDTQKISARFDNSKLFVTMPKLISPAAKEEGKLQPLETRKPQKPTKKPFAAPDVTMPKLISPEEKEDRKLPTSETQKPQKPTEEPMDTPEKNREQASLKTLASDDQNKQNGTKNIPEESHVEEETKSQEQAGKKTLGKDDQEKQTDGKNVPDKSLERDQTESSNVKSQEQAHEKPLTRDDQNKQTIAENVAEKSLEKDKTESSNVKSQEPDREKTSASEDQDKQNIARNVPEKSIEKKETESSNTDNKNVIGPAGILKMASQKMILVLFILLAILIALYVSNLIWYSKKAEN